MQINKEMMIGKGSTAEIYRLEDKRILKLLLEGFDKKTVEREYQNNLFVQTILNCVPKAYEMVEINQRHGIVYEEILGTDMLSTMLTSIRYLPKVGKELAHYHLQIQKPIKDKLLTVKEKLEEDIAGVEEISDKNKRIILDYIKGLPEGDHLCHFDFHPGNIMISDNKAVIIDWMNVCKGDVCADVARTSIILKYSSIPYAHWIISMIRSIIQHQVYKVYIKEYIKESLMISKHCMEDIAKWEIPVAAARLRERISVKEKEALLKFVKEQCEKLDC